MEQEVRASDDLYTQPGDAPDTVRVVLQQPAQLTGRTDEPLVPHIQGDELCVRNAGVHLRDQAKVQNIKHFMDWEPEWLRQQMPVAAAVDHLAGSIAGQQPPPDAAVQQITPPPPVDSTVVVHMETSQPEAEKVQGDTMIRWATTTERRARPAKGTRGPRRPSRRSRLVLLRFGVVSFGMFFLVACTSTAGARMDATPRLCRAQRSELPSVPGFNPLLCGRLVVSTRRRG